MKVRRSVKRLLLLATLATLALPASALAQGECPATMKPTGSAVGGLLGPEVVLGVYANPPSTNPIETPHGAVHWEITKSLVYAEPEPSRPLEAKRVWNSLSNPYMFSGPFGGAEQVLVTVYYKVWGPGTRYDPYYLNYDGVEGACVVNSATPEHNGPWPTRDGESRPIR